MSHSTIVYYVHQCFPEEGYSIVRDVTSKGITQSYVTHYESLTAVLAAATTLTSGGAIADGIPREKEWGKHSSWGALFGIRADNQGIWHCLTD